MTGEEIEQRLKRAEAEVESVLTSLQGNVEPVHCVAEGRLDVALYAIKEVLALTLAGEIPKPPDRRPIRVGG